MGFMQLQSDIGAWASSNFGDGNPRLALLGLMEESGELCHAVLKATQRIRGTEQEHMASVRDAVADIFIYLVDFMRRASAGQLFINLNFCNVTSTHFSHSTPWPEAAQKPVSDLYKAIAELYAYFEPYFFYSTIPYGDVNVEVRRHCYLILTRLLAVCNTIGFDFSECVETIWSQTVSKRNWKMNPKNGASL